MSETINVLDMPSNYHRIICPVHGDITSENIIIKVNDKELRTCPICLVNDEVITKTVKVERDSDYCLGYIEIKSEKFK